MSPDEVMKTFSAIELTDGEREYLRGQSRRIAYLITLIQSYVSQQSADLALMDVGPHFLTRAIIDTVSPRPRISTIGYEFPKLVPAHLVDQHALIDLNESATIDPPFPPNSFDIITICEVVEHLLVPPDIVFKYLRRMLKSPGGLLLVGTPNAVCLANRLRMMVGENPFHPLSPNFRSGAGHIREYTMDELRQYGIAAGLRVHFEEYCSYWGQSMHIHNIDALESENPSYRTGLTIVYENP